MTGWVTPDVVVGHPDYGKAVPCRCAIEVWEDQKTDRLRRFSNLGPLTRLTFDRLAPQGKSAHPENQYLFTNALQAARGYAREPEGWFVLVGASGSGKTHLAAAIANVCMERGLQTYFMVVPDLLDHLRSTFSPSSDVSYDNLFEQVRNIPLLVLDDLGTQSSTPWAAEKLFQLLNHRFNAQLPTVVTTNVSLERLDERLHSRLTDPAFSKVYTTEKRSFIPNTPDTLDLSLPAQMRFETFQRRGRNLKGKQAENLDHAFRQARIFAESPDGWIVFMGHTGRGKTHLAAAIGHYRRNKGTEVVFILVSDLLDHLRSTFAPESRTTYDDMFNKARMAPLLILDDYGEHSATPWAREKLHQLFNHRYNSRLPTVITTTLALEEIDSRLSSRMEDDRVTTLVRITTPDYRNWSTPTDYAANDPAGKRRVS